MIVKAFVNRCIDQARKASGESYQYFRKKFVEAIDQAHEFQKHKNNASGAIRYYSLPPHEERILRVTADDWADFSFPPGVPSPLSFSDACKAETVRKLAAAFYRKAVETTGGLSWRVRVNDCIGWIRDKEGIPPDRKNVPLDDDANIGFVDRLSALTDASPEPVCVPFPDRKTVRRWAESVVESLTDRSREALKYHACYQYTFEKTARRIGLKNASGVAVHFENAVLKIRKKYREAVEQSDFRFSEDLQEMLLDMICEIIAPCLKKRAPRS